MKDDTEVRAHKKMCQQLGVRQYTVKVIILWGDKIIVLKRDKKRIELVGGLNKPEDDEDVRVTAVRKVKDETGISITPDQLELFRAEKAGDEGHGFYCYKVAVDDECTRDILQKPCANGGIPKAYRLRNLLNIPPQLPRSHVNIVNAFLRTV